MTYSHRPGIHRNRVESSACQVRSRGKALFVCWEIDEAIARLREIVNELAAKGNGNENCAIEAHRLLNKLSDLGPYS